VAFANEIGNIAQAVGVDSWDVMDIFCQDTKLNISTYYMKPGFAFGGSCLPKDVRALTFKGRDLDLELPLLNSLTVTNAQQIERAVEMVAARGVRNISFLGISFKSGTDDLRESPQVALVERLIGKGFNLRIYDRNVHLARLMGANRAYIEETIPHIAEILSDDMDAVLSHGGLVIVGNPAPEFKFLASKIRADQHVLDLARIPGIAAELGERYSGINW
jgi:GDP-mannose 6-dehydrogenase